MDQYIEFIGNHIFLFVALLVVIILLVQNLLADGGKYNIPPGEATGMINRDDAVVVDVRPMNDFSTGHIINAINIPANTLQKQISRLEKEKEKPIIIACRSGSQSAAACKTLRKSGFEKVYNLRGGMMAWQSANLPISHK